MGRTGPLVSLTLWLLGLNADAVDGRECHGDAAKVLKRGRDVSEQNGLLQIV